MSETKRDKKGRFVKGTKPGPGRPKKVALKTDDLVLWGHDLLRQAWLTFKVVNKYAQLGILKCHCGNDSPDRFDYEFASGKIRARCKRCGRWNDFKERHAWYVSPLPKLLPREDMAKTVRHRKGTVEMPDETEW